MKASVFKTSGGMDRQLPKAGRHFTSNPSLFNSNTAEIAQVISAVLDAESAVSGRSPEVLNTAFHAYSTVTFAARPSSARGRREVGGVTGGEKV